MANDHVLRRRAKRSLLRQKNKIRGVLGDAQTKGRNTHQPETIYRERIRAVLLKARDELEPSAWPEFLGWLGKVTAAGSRGVQRAFSYGIMRPMLMAPRISVSDELDWLAKRLGSHINELSSFRQTADRLNIAFWDGNERTVWDLLQTIESDFGTSLWSMELRIALEQFFHGLEAQKAYLETVKSDFPGGLATYIAHFVSVRNEARSTIRLFRSDALRKIEDTKLSDQGRIYLRYKLADCFNGQDSDISAILRTEQGQSIIDVYETVIDVLQRLVKIDAIDRYKSAAIGILSALGTIGDFRVEKLRQRLGFFSSADLEPLHAKSFQAVARGDLKQAYREAIRYQKLKPADALAGAERAMLGSFLNHPCAVFRREPWALIDQALWAVLARNERFEEASGTTEKFCRNLRGLSTAVALGDFSAYLIGSSINVQTNIATMSLNSDTWSPMDYLLVDDSLRQEFEAKVKTAYGFSVASMWSGSVQESASDVTKGGALYIASTIASRRNPARALSILKDIDSNHLAPALRGIVSNLRIDLALREGDRNLAITYIAESAAVSPSFRLELPAELAIEGRSWDELGEIQNKLDLSIALDVLWRKTSEDLYATYLRFALEDHLAHEKIDRPSDIGDPSPSLHDRIVYFLRYVCVPAILDQSGAFNTTRELAEERISICRRLAAMDPQSGATYEDEIAEAERRILIQDGLQIVDNSRVNVDTAAISRWAEQRYRESFSRYKALVEAGIGVADDFDKVLRAVLKQTGKVNDFFNVPESEADSLLLEMIFAIKEEFLNNPVSGLEFYLGKRIRHGTLSGHLRGPLEKAQLITQRSSEAGPYESNVFWLDRLSFPSADDREAVDFAFTAFASSYDEMVSQLKDNALHVKSKFHRQGLFEINITSPTIHVMRSAIQTELQFEAFLKSCYTTFWALLDPSLTAARKLLTPGAKEIATRIFDELLGVVRANAIQDDAYHYFSTVIRDTASEVQRQLDTMADWLKRPEIEELSRRFELAELLDIAIQSALKTHKAFSPKIERHVTGNVTAPAALLSIVADVVFVIIDNVCRRSMSGSCPSINMNLVFERDTETLLLEAVNTVGRSLDRVKAEEQLEILREKIARGDIQTGARREGGSGLLKIASITQQSKRGSLEFGFVDDGHFLTRVRLSVISDKEGSASARVLA
ncbi:MAG TPA: hypothetical protein VGG48_01945 [Rhizomicrobium sp.]|jgi:hypothetical protein